MQGFTVHLNSMTGTQFSGVDKSCRRVSADDPRLKSLTCKSIGISDSAKCMKTQLWLDDCNAYDVGKGSTVKLACSSKATGYLCDGVAPVKTQETPACKALPWCTKVDLRFKPGSKCQNELPLNKRGESYTRNFYCPVSELNTNKCKVVLGNDSSAKEYCSTGGIDPKYNWLMMPSSRR